MVAALAGGGPRSARLRPQQARQSSGPLRRLISSANLRRPGTRPVAMARGSRTSARSALRTGQAGAVSHGQRNPRLLTRPMARRLSPCRAGAPAAVKTCCWAGPGWAGPRRAFDIHAGSRGLGADAGGQTGRGARAAGLRTVRIGVAQHAQHAQRAQHARSATAATAAAADCRCDSRPAAAAVRGCPLCCAVCAAPCAPERRRNRAS
jgi:hypothetical protein